SLFALIALVWVGCEGDYRPKASGGFGEVVVVMDSTQWESATAKAIRNTYGKSMLTLPGPEPRFDLRFRDLKVKISGIVSRSSKILSLRLPLTTARIQRVWLEAYSAIRLKNRYKMGSLLLFPSIINGIRISGLLS